MNTSGLLQSMRMSLMRLWPVAKILRFIEGLVVAGSTVAQLEVLFCSDFLWAVSHFLCFTIVRFDHIASLCWYIASMRKSKITS